MSVDLNKIISFAKESGFIFPSSEIYGGLKAVYDFGPLGVLLKNNLRDLWWQEMVQKNLNVYGLDASIFMQPIVWQASGHLKNFTDPLIECLNCQKRYRADQLLEEKGINIDDKTPVEEITKIIADNKIKCPSCGGELGSVKTFNLMLGVNFNKVGAEEDIIYLRPETAQGIFVNFKNVQQTMRAKLPFGIAQIGKAFRNEITTKQFIFRTKEFSQMEMQYFVKPEQADLEYKKLKQKRLQWWLDLGLPAEKLRFHEHEKPAHYAKAAFDIEYKFPWGWKEIEGLHNRSDYDLNQHAEYSQKNLKYRDPQTNEEYFPYILEASTGLDRNVFTLLVNSYTEVETRSGDKNSKHETEVVLKLNKKLAPIKIAVFPLLKKEPLKKMALEIVDSLKNNFMVQYDESGSIGKRYRRQDQIGTPYCLTVDFDSLDNQIITIRDRDTMSQEHIHLNEVLSYFNDKFNN